VINVKRLPHLTGAVVLAAGLLAAGCNIPPKPMKFNNDMAKANQRLASAAKEFAKKLEPLSKGQPVASGEVRSAYQAMSSALASVRKDYEEMLSPNRSKFGDALLEKYKAFLTGQQKILDGPMKQISQIAEDPGKDPGTKWREIEPLIQQCAQDEQQWIGEVSKVQGDFARDHNYEVK
jgi:hypothetical protein